LQVIGQPFERVQEIIIEYLVRNILKDTERDDVPLLVDAVASSATLPNTLTRLSIATSVVVPQTMFGWVSKIACFSHLTSLSLEYDYHRGSHDKKQLLVEVVIANLGHGVLPNLTKLALPLPLQSPEDKWIWDFSSFTTVIDMKFYENFIGKGVCLSTYLHKGLDATHYCPPVDLGRLLEFTSLMFAFFCFLFFGFFFCDCFVFFHMFVHEVLTNGGCCFGFPLPAGLPKSGSTSLYPIGKLKTICPVHIYGVSQL
jgi:hypothetical protein